VITEAMASGIPVVAVHGPGNDDTIISGYNGQLVDSEILPFCHAVEWYLDLDKSRVKRLRMNVLETAKKFSKTTSVNSAFDAYCSLVRTKQFYRVESDTLWEKAKRVIKTELELLKIMTNATGAAITEKSN
jgi:glycosyltransferase involved in cell wall biosynthesis